MYYYRARYYHPALQRFISEDPIGFNGGDVNLYGYVFNDPINLVDPTGKVVPAIIACYMNPLCAGAVIGGISGGVGAAISGQGPLDVCKAIAAGAIGGAAGGLMSGPGPSAAFASGFGAFAAAASGANPGGIAGAAYGSALGGGISGLGGAGAFAAGTWRSGMNGTMFGIIGNAAYK